jgi:hypothetical protein
MSLSVCLFALPKSHVGSAASVVSKQLETNLMSLTIVVQTTFLSTTQRHGLCGERGVISQKLSAKVQSRNKHMTNVPTPGM